ncbi:MAG: hypothetical protein RLP09_12840, partial [Sandaracinaceae bacterium]
IEACSDRSVARAHRLALARSAHQRREEPPLLGARREELRMPLHADAERRRAALDALHDAQVVAREGETVRPSDATI